MARLSRRTGRVAFLDNRIIESTVRFASPFQLAGFDAPEPAGEYRTEREEEPIEGLSRPAWRCVNVWLFLPAVATGGAVQQMIRIDAADLEVALNKDQQTS